MKKILLICLCLLGGLQGWSLGTSKLAIEQCFEAELQKASALVWPKFFLTFYDEVVAQTEIKNDKEKILLQEVREEMKNALADALAEGNWDESNPKLKELEGRVAQENLDLAQRIDQSIVKVKKQLEKSLAEELQSVLFDSLNTCIEQADLSTIAKEAIKIGVYTDGLVLDDINTELTEKVRRKFEPAIPYDEEILYVSNKPGWLKATSSVITNKKLYRYNKPAIALEQFFGSSYNADNIYFGKNNHISLTELKEDYSSEDFPSLGEQIYKSLRKMAYLSFDETFWQEFQKVPKNKREDFLSKNFDKQNWQCYYAAALIDYEKYQQTNAEKNREEAAEELKQAISLIKDLPIKEEKAYSLIDLALELKEYKMARDLAYKYDTTVKRIYQKKAENEFLEHFFEIDKNDRKLIVLVDKVIALEDNAEAVPLDIHKLPKGLTFSTDRQNSGEIYIAHPYTQQYLLLESGYEWKLLKEQMFEFCRIMRDIGAENCLAGKVSLKSNGNQSTDSLDLRGAVDGEKGTLGVKAGGRIGGGYNREATDITEHYQEEVNNLSQEFNPPSKFKFTGKEDYLIWYPHKTDTTSSWHHLVQQVKEEANLATTAISFSTKNIHQLQQVDCKEIQGQLEGYIDAKMISKKGGIELSYKRCNDSKAKEEIDISLNFTVTFPTTQPAQ